MRIDLPTLEALEAVVDCGSIAGAADRLHKARSAISYHLRRLEELLAVPILDRSGYRLSLTAEGKVLLDEARAVLRRARELEEFAGQIRGGWEPSLKIFFDGVLPIEWILHALEDLEQVGAPTRIELRVEYLDEVERAFSTLDGDVMISCTATAAPHLRVQSLANLELVLYCRAEHPLAKLATVSRSDLESFTELVIQGAETAAGTVRPFFASRRVFFLSDFNMKVAAIRKGLGFGWLPEHLADPLLRSGELVEVPLASGSRFALNASVVTRSDRTRGKALQLIVDRLASSASFGVL